MTPFTTRRLLPMLLVSAGLAAAAAVLGHAGAIWLPLLAGFPPTSTAGTMAFASGVLFLVAMLASILRRQSQVPQRTEKDAI